MVPTTHARWLCLFLTVIASALTGTSSTEGAVESLPKVVEFNRDVRPVLSDACFACHGPDKEKRKADLRLDTPADVFADREGKRVLVPGDPTRSELYRRISAHEGSKRMPPAKTGRRLTDRQVALVGRWIEQGAKWQAHWSFIAPRRPPLPTVSNPRWPRNPIDHFILERLDGAGLAPSPEAEKTTLIRRVTLDLTGLQPTPAEVDAFLADRSPDAYERVVNRLLDSPRFGERMATRWLDAARYADTNGYQTDGERHMWRWRDWVINAFNDNMPFDQFTVEQLAGDLLPKPTLEQRIATGFNRNHRGNAEGGIVPEEYAVEYVADRVETTATVWLGLTVGCSRCHDHKFDPLRQKEFYQVFAFFNNVPEKGRAIKYGNSPPMISAPTQLQLERQLALKEQLVKAEADLARLAPQLAVAEQEAGKTLQGGGPLDWTVTRDLAAHFDLNGDTVNKAAPEKKASVKDGAAYVAGRVSQAGDFDGRRYLDAGDLANFGFYDKFTLAAWIYPRGQNGGTIVSRMADVPQGDGYSFRLDKGKVQLNLVKRWLDDALRVETATSLAPDRWHHVVVTYDGSRIASGVKFYVDGRPEPLHVLLDDLNQTFAATKEPLRVGGGGGPDWRFHGYLDDVRVYADVLQPDEIRVVATADSIRAIAAVPPAARTSLQSHKLRTYILEKDPPPPLRAARERFTSLRKQLGQLVAAFPTVMVMEEMPAPRDTHVLVRGVYNKPGAKVSPGVPASLPKLPAGPPTRLTFARWLVDPSNPLTARVAVNRYWQMYFANGIVKTVDDFGSQGEWPSHPELLDWLATEFVRTGWDVKALQRLIVTSATYRQSSRLSKALVFADPENRLLARGPRIRLSAEMIRDQALAASGLIAERLGGPSVKPYQPAGLWKELSDTDYVQDKGESLYRRSMYTYWKRTVAPPSMVTFDAAGREICTVRETRTNTPLQALTLMNETTFVESSRVMAQRVMTESGPTSKDRIRFAFRVATGRVPRPEELDVLVSGYQDQLDRFRRDRKEAMSLVSAGEYPRNEKLDVAELAAYTTVAGILLNLDETITKE